MWCFFCAPSRCACGQLTTQHVAIPPGANSLEEAHQLVQIDTPKDKWSVIKHTRTYPTDSFGLIEFQGGGFINKAMVSPNYVAGQRLQQHEGGGWTHLVKLCRNTVLFSASISESRTTPSRTTSCI